MSREQTLDISWEAVFKFLIAGLILYLAFILKDIIVWFLFALIISILLEPAIKFLRWAKIPKVLAVILVYLSIFGILGILIFLTAPVFIEELKQFAQALPGYFEKISPYLKQFGIEAAQSFDNFTASLRSNLEQSSAGIFGAVMSFFGGLASTAFILTLAFFLSLQEKGVDYMLMLLSPKKYEDYIIAVFERAQTKVAGWFGARIVSCIFVGVASYVVFFIFKIKYAFILALISGVLNFVPYIGPWITSILIILFVGVSGSWLTALYALIGVTVVQEIDNKLLSPVLMKKFIDLPPVLVLLALVIGGEMFGFLGTIFSVPIAGIIYEFLKEFLEKKKEETQLA